MEAKSEITSKQFIKPSSTTPHLLKDFQLSFLDQLSSYHYIPVLLFYPSSDVNGYDNGFRSLCDKLKASLSDVLTLYHPFCGRIKGNSYINCNDEGVLFIEARVSSQLTTILENPQVNELNQLLPIDPYGQAFVHNNNYEEQVMMAVQVSELSCGGAVLGLCISHKIVDGIALASFLNDWVETSKVNGNPKKPYMEASLLFPIKDMKFITPSIDVVENKELVTIRLVFDGTNLSKLRAGMDGYYTRVEAVTALIWKSMIEASLASPRGQKLEKSMAAHIVNIRGRIEPPLPENNIGNLIQFAATPSIELQVDKIVELQDLALMIRKAITRLDADYVSKLVGDNGFDMFMEYGKKHMVMNSENIQLAKFSSWTRFPLYETDFGWGKPTWVSTICFPIENNVLLMSTRCGKGIEAWVVLDKQDMVGFESNQKLQQYASVSRASS